MGTTTGLHARRLAAMRRANPRCDQDRLAYGEILRNSAISAARFLNKATMLPYVVRIATTGKDVMTEITVPGVTTGTTGPGHIMTTNKGIMLRCVVRTDGVSWRY